MGGRGRRADAWPSWWASSGSSVREMVHDRPYGSQGRSEHPVRPRVQPGRVPAQQAGWSRRTVNQPEKRPEKGTGEGRRSSLGSWCQEVLPGVRGPIANGAIGDSWTANRVLDEVPWEDPKAFLLKCLARAGSLVYSPIQNPPAPSFRLLSLPRPAARAARNRGEKWTTRSLPCVTPSRGTSACAVYPRRPRDPPGRRGRTGLFPLGDRVARRLRRPAAARLRRRRRRHPRGPVRQQQPRRRAASMPAGYVTPAGDGAATVIASSRRRTTRDPRAGDAASAPAGRSISGPRSCRC